MNSPQAVTISQLTRRIGAIIAADPQIQNVWVVAETSDVRVSGGHCYLELIEKDSSGRAIAKARATIWASTYYTLANQFLVETGQQFRSDLKVMVRVSPNFHSVYGFSLNISAINSAYTMGDALQRRAEMIERLRKEDIIDDNRNLRWPIVPQRIAIISAAGAAGYGDFVNQLYSNSSRLRFTAKLFPAVLQGERTAASIIAALDAIYKVIDQYDGVVIIRGGGATSELACFDNYELAAHIAQFPLPVIIGIGHERDITLLDYVANMRVKTPTAAAEWLIQRGEALLGHLQGRASQILQAVTDRLSGCHRQLAFYAGQLPAAANAAVVKAQNRLFNARVVLSGISDRRLRPEIAKLENIKAAIAQATDVAVKRQQQRLDAMQELLDVLSPEATLRRGYTITRVAGRALTSPDGLAPGEVIETSFATGTLLSTTILDTTH